MIARLLGIEDDGTLTYVEAALRHPWPAVVLLLLTVAAVALVVALYRREHGLTRTRRSVLIALRSLLLALLLLILFEPVLGLELAVRVRSNVLVLLDVSQSMALGDRRTTHAAQRRAAKAMGLVSYDDPLPADVAVPADVRPRVAAVPRIDLARAVLQNEQLDLLGRIGRDHQLRFFTFGQGVASVDLERERGAWMMTEPDQPATELGVALQDAAARFGGQTIAGVIVLSDGASNQGVDPIDAAHALGRRSVPVHTVGIGLPDPPDVAIASVVVPETVFAHDDVPVRIHLRSTGYEGRTVELAATLNGQPIARQSILLVGGNQFEEITFAPGDKAGSLQLNIAVDPLPDEASAANNRATRRVRVIDDRIKVLYVEGRPRWEYRYLRAVLLRDRRLDTYFLMTEGDQELATVSDRHVSRFPQEAQDLFEYDLIIIGDVPAMTFTPTQMELIERLVRERGGSVLMLAGRRQAPATFAGTPIETLLPVRPRSGGPVAVSDDLAPRVTPEGRRAGVTLLEADPQRNDEIWSLVKPLYGVPPLAGAKPGATVLLDLPGVGDVRDYPLVAWHRYGSGKAMYVGTDQLWRLRFKRGDFHHARFWGQSIQFLALSRLLGENKRVRVELERGEYKAGERIGVYVHALTEGYDPLRAPQVEVRVEAVEGDAEPRTVTLQPASDTPGLFQGVYVAEAAGRYRVSPVGFDAQAVAVAEFTATAVPLEMLEPAMQERMLRQIAEASGGRYHALDDLPGLVEAFDAEPRTMVVRREKDLWDSPLVLLLALGLAGAEWLIRRQSNLV